MFEGEFFHSPLFNWFVLPLVIFLSRMTDVTLGTLRHIFIGKGLRKIVPFLGFIEVFIWIVIIGQIMKNINNMACYVAWAGGFAMGTYIGMKIDEELALGLQVLRIITHRNCDELLTALREANHGITIIEGQGSKGPVKIIFTIIQRKDVPAAAKLIERFNPSAFYSLEDIRAASSGVFPQARPEGYFSRMFDTRK